ncbi:hypothetical protein [Streptomyces sp. NPDC093591]|uniref:hypothetical protein n=1 Tax=Streptomyces sp. NPDC093591 TaxID=3366044 RepID=UPI003815ED5F
MRVRDLAELYPAVSADDDVAAARVFVERRLPALLVLDADQRLHAVVTGSQLLNVMVADCALKDPALAGALRETDTEPLKDHLGGRAVEPWLPRHGAMPAMVGPDTDAVQIAALITRTRTPTRGGRAERAWADAHGRRDQRWPADGVLPHVGMGL